MDFSTLPRATSALSFALAVAAALAPATASAAPGDPPCAPDKTLAATFAVQEGDEPASLVATHDVQILAEWSGEVRNPSLSVPDGVRVLRRQPRQLRLIVPFGASLAVTASWEQATDPSDPDSDPSNPATRCNATQTTALPVLATHPPRVVYDIHSAGFDATATFAVVPDRTRGDRSPLTISARIGRAARFPSPGTRARTMTVPMREADVVRYRRRLPGTSNQTTPVKCRLFSLTCGRVTTDAYALGRLRRVTRRALFFAGGDLLARTQPLRRAAPYGVRTHVHVFSVGFKGPRTLGYDVQIRQSGALLARVRRAARCRPEVRFQFKRLTCRVGRSKNG
jgi:hypothetical protein